MTLNQALVGDGSGTDDTSCHWSDNGDFKDIVWMSSSVLLRFRDRGSHSSCVEEVSVGAKTLPAGLFSSMLCREDLELASKSGENSP